MTPVSNVHTDRLGVASRKAVVIGGTTGIGRAIAVLLTQSGVLIFICRHCRDHLRALLTQPRRAVVQQLTIGPRMQDKE